MKKMPESEKEWKTCLTPEQYHVLREKGTEQAFTGKLLKEKRKGVFVCAACDNEIFSSETKFDSGTGWPSFYDAKPGSVEFRTDFKMIMPRKEVLCAKCGSHLGHMFGDGPKPTGKRYCINSAALGFRERKGKRE